MTHSPAMTQDLFIGIAGLIGAGKTTLATALAISPSTRHVAPERVPLRTSQTLLRCTFAETAL